MQRAQPRGRDRLVVKRVTGLVVSTVAHTDQIGWLL
jgi:hypothetical protein